jgi:hypothetical protein
MLSTIKSYIENVPDIPFLEYYQAYILDVQDQNVLTETKYAESDDTKALKLMLMNFRYRRF